MTNRGKVRVTMTGTIGFVTVVESGDLESQAVFLVESIRRLPELRDSPIYVVQPRLGRPVSQKTLRHLSALDALFVSKDLNRTWRHHGLMNKVYASAPVESWVEGELDTLVLLDTDTVVIDALDALRLSSPYSVAATPEHSWEIAERIGQPIDTPLSPFWQMIFDNCHVNMPIDWSVRTIVDECQILPYFNSGVVAVKPERGIFRTWRENVERLATDERARRLVPGSPEFFFVEQSMLAGTVLGTVPHEEIQVLDARFNYPFPSHKLLPAGTRVAQLDDASIVHYHDKFFNLYWMDDVAVSAPLAGWLRSRLPLRPRVRRKRVSALYLSSWLLSQAPMRRRHRHLAYRVPRLRNTLLREPSIGRA